MGRKTKAYEFDGEEYLDLTVGSYSSWTEIKQDDEPVKKAQIGFIRPREGPAPKKKNLTKQRLCAKVRK